MQGTPASLAALVSVVLSPTMTQRAGSPPALRTASMMCAPLGLRADTASGPAMKAKWRVRFNASISATDRSVRLLVATHRIAPRALSRSSAATQPSNGRLSSAMCAR